MNRRADKLSSVIHKQIGFQLQQLELPFLTTISKVEISPDLKYAKIWITVLPSGKENEKEILGLLKENTYELQGNLNRELSMKMTPRISFAIDTSQEYAAHISELIKKTHEDEE